MNTKPMSLAIAGMLLALLSACSEQTAQEKGKEMATEKIDIATGVGNALQDKGAEAGEAVANGVGVLFQGVEKGFMKSGRAIVADPSLASAGLTVTKIQDGTRGDTPSLDAYVVATTAASGTLRALVFDATGQEIGRSTVRIERGADEAKYESVPFDAQVPLSQIRKVAFSFRPGAADGNEKKVAAAGSVAPAAAK